MIARAALAALCISFASAAQAECLPKRMLEAFLKQNHDMRLHSWGLNSTGAMIELWLAPDGLFAVVTTTPNKCTTVEVPTDLRGRLWTPPSPNKAIPEDRTMNNGQGL